MDGRVSLAVHVDDKWTQIVFVVAITVGVFFYNRQKRTIYNYEPPSEERIPCDTIPSSEQAACLRYLFQNPGDGLSGT